MAKRVGGDTEDRPSSARGSNSDDGPDLNAYLTDLKRCSASGAGRLEGCGGADPTEGYSRARGWMNRLRL